MTPMMTPDAHSAVPRDEERRLTPELVLVGAGLGDAEDDAPARIVRRKAPLPTLHLAAHEIISFPAPSPAEPT